MVPPAAPPAPATPAPWFDDTYKDLVADKGWKTPNDAIQSYAALLPLIGRDKLPLPAGPDDAEGWDRVYDRLGRPATPADYKFQLPEGDAGEFAAAMAPLFHKARLTQQQLDVLAPAWNEYVAATTRARDDARAAEDRAAIGSLQKEWGAEYDRNVELARRAARAFAGQDNDGGLDELERALGTSGMVKLFARIGQGFGLGGLEGGVPQGGQMDGPAAAKAEIARLVADPAFQKAWLHDTGAAGKAAREKMEQLQKVAAGMPR